METSQTTPSEAASPASTPDGGKGLGAAIGSALSPTQKKVLRWAAQGCNGHVVVAGNGMAPYVSAARALVRKKLLLEWKTSHYAITEAGEIAHAQSAEATESQPGAEPELEK